MENSIKARHIFHDQEVPTWETIEIPFKGLIRFLRWLLRSPLFWTIELVIVSGRDLGFSFTTTEREIFAHAASRFCPIPGVVKEYFPKNISGAVLDRPEYENLLWAFGANDHVDVLWITKLQHGEWKLILVGNLNQQWSVDQRWVFARRGTSKVPRFLL